MLLAVKASYCVSVDSLSGCSRCVAPVKSGFVSKTRYPVPFVTGSALKTVALVNEPSIVATFAARPLTPVEIGKPVQFVSVPLAGVPKIGVVEFVSRRPVVPLKVAICPEVTVPPVFKTRLRG